MSYTIYNANGTPVVIPDNVIDTEFYDTTNNVGIQLVGRNAIDYGAPIAQNFLQQLENFAGTNRPSTWAPQGMLWFDTASKNLFLKFQTTGSTDSANWAQVILSSASGSTTVPGNLVVSGSMTLTGPLTGTNANFAGSITAASGTFANLFATTIGSPSQPISDIYGGTFHDTSTQAEYADLAERYEADKSLSAGTVVSLGGQKEITTTTVRGDLNVFGVISKNPGLMLNANAGDNDTHPYVALSGRVHVFVTGKVKKGDRLIASSVAGAAESVDAQDLHLFNSYQIIGRALENKTTNGLGQVLAVVGAK